MTLFRTAISARTGCTLGPREQMNDATSFIDASPIYGSNRDEAERLRTFSQGQLKTHPPDNLPPNEEDPDATGDACKGCFLQAGDVRASEHVTDTALNAVWVLQHNSVAGQLAELNPHWNDEQLFQEARRIVSAQIQHITYNEFLPVVLGKDTVDTYDLSPQKAGFFGKYNINTNPGTANSVAVAALRFAVSLVPSHISFVDDNGAVIREEPWSNLHHRPDRIRGGRAFENLVRGLMQSPAQAADRHISAQLTNRLFAANTSLGLDQAAQIIQQGRDHGIPGYIAWRAFCDLPAVNSFADLRGLMDQETVSALQSIYTDVSDIDLFTGGLSERPASGAVVGPTFACLLGTQMHYYKTGDRYWYENDIPPSSFSREQLNEIRKTSLARVLCDNIPGLATVQPNVFLEADTFLNAPMACEGNQVIPSLNLGSWATASPRFIVPDNILVDSIERARRDVTVVRDLERDLFRNGHMADPKSAAGSAYGFMRPKRQSSEISNTSFVLQYASRRFLDTLLAEDTGLTGSGSRRKSRQLQDAEFANKGIGNLQELMDVLPNIDVSDVVDIPKVFRCDEQTLPCDHTTKYRTLTGWCNNLHSPEYGKSIRAFTRLLAPAYDDGLSSPRSRSVTGKSLPSPRLVSVNIHNDISAPHSRYTLLVMQYAQFCDHDLSHTPVNRGFGDSILMCKACDSQTTVHPECLPIPVPKGDPHFPSTNVTTGKPFCLAFTRSMPGQLTLGFREQMNQITSFADSSNVYGSDLCEARELRELVGGRLNATRPRHGGKDLLPMTTENAECKAKSGFCFEAGDARSSEQPVLAAIHTVFMRMHNQLADELSRLNPHWSDETLYQEARRIVSALQQQITWNEFLPRILGWNAINLYELGLVTEGYYEGYDDKCNPTILNEFAAAAFRFGHSLLKPAFKRMDNAYKDGGPELKLSDMFFNPDKLHDAGMIDELMRGISTTPMETLDQFITSEVTNHLFEDKKLGPHSGMDLVSLNLQRARDHGVPGYNMYRAICNLTKAEDFEGLSREVAPPLIERLKRTYDHVDDIDLFTGLLAETPLHGGLVGPTFACIIGIQFRNLRKCDRFWYETSNPLIRFTENQLAEIRKVTLSKVLCETGDAITTMQRSAFDIPDPFLNPRVKCASLPGINLELWKERVTCQVDSITIETGEASRVSPCVMCTCTKEGPLCQSLRVENCFHLAQSFSPKAILDDHVCKVQCAFAFRSFPSVRTDDNHIGFS